MDLLLPEEGPGDELLAKALNRGPSALAVGLDEEGHWVLPNRVLRPSVVGHVSFDLDRDGVVRRFSSTKEMSGISMPALPVAAARLGNDPLPIPVGVMIRPGFRTRPIAAVSAASILEAGHVEVLKDRIVFIGTSAAGVGDRFISPVSQGGSPEPGVQIEAISAQALLSKDLLRPASPLINALLAFGLGLLVTFLLALPRRSIPLIGSGLVLAPFLISAASLSYLRLELAALSVLFPLLLTGVLMALDRSRRSSAEMNTAQGRISELEILQESISETRKQDAEARRVVAHELKTPLTSVRGLAQLLAQFDLSPSERNRVALMVVSETSRLAQMVDALLDLERLRLRDFDRDAKLLDLSALCIERVGFLRAGTQRDIVANIVMGQHVLGDKALLERVIENLVSNAIKFSPAGTPIRVGVRVEESLAVFEVEDHGPGVPMQERERIFGRFARGSAQGLAPGLGLGLALVAEVVGWHHGSVEAAEGTDGGSIFRVRLPLSRRP